MFIFLLLNTLTIWSAFLVVYKLLRIEGTIDSLLGLFVVYFAQIVLVEMVLGVMNVLYPKSIIILTLIIFFALFMFSRNRKSSFIQFDLGSCLNCLLSSKIYTFIFSVAISFFAVKILVNLFNPPFGWDSLNYHFTFPVEWLKHANLNNPITAFDDPSPTYYPINGSLFYFWLMFPFRSVFLADLGQAPFLLIAIISVYGISRKIGLDNKKSFYAAMLFMLIPNFFKQLQIAYVDVMVASLFLICVNFLLLLNKNFDLPNTLIYSLSLGLLIGTKTVALPYSILLIIPFVAMALRNYRKSTLILVFFICVVFCGGFSYIRNYIETGNPLYPLDFVLFNIHIFKGVLSKAAYSSHFNSADYSIGKALFHEGLGVQGLLLILPSVFLALPVALFKKRKSLDFNLMYLFILPLLLYLVYRFVIPLGNLRYLYNFMGLGIVLGFYVFDALGAKGAFINTLVVISALVSISELAKRQELIFSILFSALVFFALIRFRKIKINPRKILILFSAAIFVAVFVGEKFYKTNEYPRYYKMIKYSGFWQDATKAWDWLNSNTSGNNVAYAGRPVPFPLYGSGFKNNVYYVSVNRVEPAKSHYFSGGNYDWGGSYEYLHKHLEDKGNYRQDASYSLWLNNLIKTNTDFIFIYSLHQIKGIDFPLEDAWVKQHTDKFALVFSNDTVHIYRLENHGLPSDRQTHRVLK